MREEGIRIAKMLKSRRRLPGYFQCGEMDGAARRLLICFLALKIASASSASVILSPGEAAAQRRPVLYSRQRA